MLRAAEDMVFSLVTGRCHTKAKVEKIFLAFHSLNKLVDDNVIVIEGVVGQTN